jgi:hypothetical protein
MKKLYNYEDNSIWKETDEGEWIKFFNNKVSNELKINENNFNKKSYINFNQINSNPKKNSDFNVNSYANNDEFLIKKIGTKVMSPSGIGTLLSVDSEKNEGTIKLNKEYNNVTLNLESIKPEFYIYLRIFNEGGDNFKNYYRLNLPAKGDILTLKNLIISLGILNDDECGFNLIYNSSELKDNHTFEQIDIKCGDKILLCGIKRSENILTRFSTVGNYWYCNPDSIIFSVSRKIKLIGVALYSSMEGENQLGTLKIFEVDGEIGAGTGRGRGRMRRSQASNENYREEIIYQQEANVQYTGDRNNPIQRINFDKPLNIKAHHDYKIEYVCTLTGELYFGGGGKATVLGNKVEFYFKQSFNDSGPTQGNFPEFYYYL